MQIELRKKTGVTSPEDLTLTIQEKTFDYLMTSTVPEVRVSAYFDRDWPQVEASYEELFLKDSPAQFKVTGLIPGSKARRGITLPGTMHEGEQLVILVTRIMVNDL